jgi:ABC-type oligopeptide transport system substrate-binding subunit
VLEPPLLNGPYRIASFEPGRRIIYERIADYWAADLLVNAGHHNPGRIIIDYYRDDTAAFESFKSGAIDIRRERSPAKWEAAYDDIPAVKDGRIRMADIPHQRPERVEAFIFNTRRPPFDDRRVRKALGLLFDFEWVNETIYHGRKTRISSFYPNSELAARGMPMGLERDMLTAYAAHLPPEIFTDEFQNPRGGSPADMRVNMRAADRLLKEAGWHVEKGRRMKDGQPLDFEIILRRPEDEKIALAFSRALEKMGIKATIRVLDAAQYLARLRDYDFDMTLYHWLSSLSPGTEQYLYWSCEAATQPARWNYAGICHPAIDGLSRQAGQAVNRDDLVATIRALDRVLLSGHYMIPLGYDGKDSVAAWRKVNRPSVTPLYGMVLETWWVEEEAE